MKSGYAAIHGLELYYEVRGSSDVPLILLHGGLHNTALDAPVADRLAETRQVIAVDLQAHGRWPMTLLRCSTTSGSRRPTCSAIRSAAGWRCAWPSSIPHAFASWCFWPSLLRAPAGIRKSSRRFGISIVAWRS